MRRDNWIMTIVCVYETASETDTAFSLVFQLGKAGSYGPCQVLCESWYHSLLLKSTLKVCHVSGGEKRAKKLIFNDSAYVNWRLGFKESNCENIRGVHWKAPNKSFHTIQTRASFEPPQDSLRLSSCCDSLRRATKRLQQNRSLRQHQQQRTVENKILRATCLVPTVAKIEASLILMNTVGRWSYCWGF